MTHTHFKILAASLWMGVTTWFWTRLNGELPSNPSHPCRVFSFDHRERLEGLLFVGAMLQKLFGHQTSGVFFLLFCPGVVFQTLAGQVVSISISPCSWSWTLGIFGCPFLWHFPLGIFISLLIFRLPPLFRSETFKVPC